MMNMRGLEETRKPPGRHHPETVYSNLYGNFDQSVADDLKAAPEEVHAQHAAWNFCGYIWFGKDNRWHEQVWQHHCVVAEIEDDDLRQLIDRANDSWGSE